MNFQYSTNISYKNLFNFPDLEIKDTDPKDLNQLCGHAIWHCTNNEHRNTSEARRLFSIAAQKGDIIAMNHLGRMYQYGIGGNIDLAQARLLYSWSAVLGNGEAHSNLSYLNMSLGLSYSNSL